MFQGRALEEIDAIFKFPFNPFRSVQVQYTDAERRVGQLEGEKGRETLESVDHYDRNIREDKGEASHV